MPSPIPFPISVFGGVFSIFWGSFCPQKNSPKKVAFLGSPIWKNKVCFRTAHVHGLPHGVRVRNPQVCWKKYCYYVHFALASKLLQLRTFKCQKWKAETLADRSSIPKFYQSPKTRWARSIWRWHSYIDRFTIGFPIIIHCILSNIEWSPKWHMSMARTWLLWDLAHRVFGLWEYFCIQLRSARVSAFHFWHLKVRSCNSFDARAKCT